MNRLLLSVALCATLAAPASSGRAQGVQPPAGMLRYPAISARQIAFVYANQLWLAPREGGMASPLAAPPGSAGFPRFSPEGKTVAFTASYDGNRDIYTLPAAGGVPFRVTHHPAGELLSGWTPDGRIIFSAGGYEGAQRMPGIFTVAAAGGLPVQTPVPYGLHGALSADGRWLAYIPYGTDFATWKRYRGGMSSDIWLFDLKEKKSKRMTDWDGTDSLPMWQGESVYYLSDSGPEHKLNIWAYDTKAGKRRQVTKFKEADVRWPSIGPGATGKGEVIFQLGAELRVLDLATEQTRTVAVTIPGAKPTLRPRPVDMARNIASFGISSTGKRALVEARGDIWSAPAKEGSARNLTRTSGVAEREPSWSPDGKWIAYLGDATGEYELYVLAADGKSPARQVTRNGSCYRWSPTWSPDSKKISFVDKTGSLYVTVVETGATKLIHKDAQANRLEASWSPDSRYLTFASTPKGQSVSRVYIADAEAAEVKQVTSGVFADSRPVFDRKGDWLYFSSSRSFSPTYEDLGTTWIYNNTEVLLAAPLRADMASPYLPKSDEEGAADEKKPDAAPKPAAPAAGATPAAAADPVSGTWEGTVSGGSVPGGSLTFTATLNLAGNAITGSMSTAMGNGAISGNYDAATKSAKITITLPNGETITMDLKLDGESFSGTATGMGSTFSVKASRKPTATPAAPGAPASPAAPAAPAAAAKPTKIDFDGLEARVIQLAPRPGRFGRLAVNDRNQLIYARIATQGASDPPAIKLFDINDEKRDEKTVAAGAGSFDISGDGKKILLVRGPTATIQDAAPGGTGETVSTDGLTASIDPRAEWKQILRDAWRMERDFFYDPNMHAMDWKAVYDRYAAMLEFAANREDVGFIIGEMIAELNVGHTYYSGGDMASAPSISVGVLGCDFALENGAYKISRIYRGAPWDTDTAGPLTQPGCKVKEGDYLLAVNGVALDPALDPWTPFAGLAGKTVVLTVSAQPKLDKEARDVPVRLDGSDGNLRYRWWIEQNRAKVDKMTGGRVGYIYVPNTGADGQTDLVRQFVGQINKEALIIDERWNGGGQIPHRFIELLNRPATNLWAVRDGDDWVWPPDGHQGPKCMLINGLAGSGGDAFPWYFKQAGLGKLIGRRTWGGLVGMRGTPQLIDGANVSVPSFAFYKNNSTWGIEGYGVDPDIEVVDDPALMQNGADPQLDAAIAQMLEELKKRPYVQPKRPPYPDKTGMEVPVRDR
jgi:tricorn protease